MIADQVLAKLFVETWNKYNADEKVDVYYINSGWCYQFAYVLRRIHKDAKIMSSGHHVWVFWNGKHYDSKHLNGSTQPLDHICECHGCYQDGFNNGAKQLTIKQMREYWDHHGYSGPVQDKVIQSTVRQYKKKLAKVSLKEDSNA